MNDTLLSIFEDLEIQTPICRSFIGEGWLPIVRDILAELRAIDKNLDVAQVKQKLGGLCIYLEHSSPQMERLIQSAADQCARTCEACGEPGQSSNRRGWISILCSDCRALPDQISYSEIDQRP